MNTRTAINGLRRTSLALSVVAAICGGVALDASAATVGGSAFATVAHPTVLARGDAVMGALPLNQPIQVVVGLKMRNKDALDAFIANNAKNQAHGKPAQIMSRDTIMANHAPTAAQAQAVADYLTRMGFRNVTITSNRMLVVADGSAATVRNAFNTTMAQVKTGDGRIAFANTGEVQVPVALQDKVQSVIGLQNVHTPHIFAKVLPKGSARPNASVHPDASVIEGVNPTWFTSIYNTFGFKGARTTNIGIVSQGDLTQTITDLEANFGKLRTIPTAVVNTNGTSSDTSNSVEWELDSQSIAGISGQALTSANQLAKITFYAIPSLLNTNLTLDFNTIETNDDVQIVNVSLGECENFEGPSGDGTAATDDGILALAVAQGQTFSVSTGDHGADECANGGTTPSYPASSPYVTAVAGTELTVNDSGGGTGPGPGGQPSYVGEVVWNELGNGHGATGGSISGFEPMPSWQTAFGLSGSLRNVADVAFDGDPFSGAIIQVNCNPTCTGEQVGGTSLAAPIFAGMWATLLTEKANNGFGFAGPVIYGLPASDFNDITSGNNGGETAGVGYDLASGRGSIIFGTQFIADTTGLGNLPPVAKFTFTTSDLSANFTDTSTDADGSIAKHSWTFGDGGTDTSANPSHTYASPGTYSVHEQVRDNQGSIAGITKSVTVHNNSTQLFGNTDFETGTAAPWNIVPAGDLTNNSGLANDGSWFVALGGGSSAHTDHASQIVTVPTGYASVTLSFFLNISTAETTLTKTPDLLSVQILEGGAVVATPARYSNLNAAAGYVQHNIDLSAYMGKKIMVQFTAANSATLPTNFNLDDVTLTAQ